MQPADLDAVTPAAMRAVSPASFWMPELLVESAWLEHAPFAFWLIDRLRPRRLVELGTHRGFSYFAFCQAIRQLGLPTIASAVDTWTGDAHAGFYGDDVHAAVAARNAALYGGFSTLIRRSFAEATADVADGSVDLLHIDGRHFYDDVREDFTLWRPKLTPDAVVLFHDTEVRERGFGVWRFFGEMAAEHPHFGFRHGFGLGVLLPGGVVPDALRPLVAAEEATQDSIRTMYAALGDRVGLRCRALLRDAAMGDLVGEVATLRPEQADRLGRLADQDPLAAHLIMALIAARPVPRGPSPGALLGRARRLIRGGLARLAGRRG